MIFLSICLFVMYICCTIKPVNNQIITVVQNVPNHIFQLYVSSCFVNDLLKHIIILESFAKINQNFQNLKKTLKQLLKDN